MHSDKETNIVNKKYRYRKHIYWAQYFIPAVFVIIILPMIGLSVLSALRGRSIYVSMMPVILMPILVIEGVLLWYLFYRLAGTVVSVNENMLVYKNRKYEERFPLENIYLEFSSIKYVGGWLKIKCGTETVRLTVVLEDISGFLQELKAVLDQKHLSSHYDSHKLFEFLKTATAADHSWERVYAYGGKILLLSLNAGMAVLAGYALSIIPRYGIEVVLFWFCFSAIWVGLAHTTGEIILIRQIAQKSDEATFTFPKRDLSYEKLVFDRVFVWGNIAYFLVTVIVIMITVLIRIF